MNDTCPPPPPPAHPQPPPPPPGAEQSTALNDDRHIAEPPERRPLDRRLVVVAVACGVAFDLAARRPITSVSVAMAFTVTAVGALASGRLESRQSRAAMAAVPLFTGWVAIRTSPWLVPLDLLAGGLLLCIALATSDGTPLRAVGPVRVAREIGLAPAALGGTVGFVRRSVPGTRLATAGRQGWPILRGLALMIPVVAILGALLASGDALTEALLGSVGIEAWVGHAVLIVIGTWLALAMLFRAASDHPQPLLPNGPRLAAVEATIVLAGIVAVHAAFTAVQVAGALGVASEVFDDPVATAEWARRGFFQLLWAAGLTLVVILALDRTVDRSDARLARRHRHLVVATCALTCVVVAVSLNRIMRYSHDFGLTMLRLYAGLFALWVAVVFVLVARRAMAGGPPGWLTMRAGASGLVLLLGLNIWNPEAFVVRADTSSEVRFDVDYLASLSTDAVPEMVDRLDRLTARQRARAIRSLCAREIPAADGWLRWNRSRAQARAALVGLCGTPDG